MPLKPRKPCNFPRCPELANPGQSYCTAHTRTKDYDREQYDRRRGTAAQRGYGSRWRRYRRKFLSEHPLCEECLKDKRTVPATDVDHITPVSGAGDSLFWKESNHQALCHSCHSKKTARENGGFGNKFYLMNEK